MLETTRKIQRSAEIVRVLLKYGFDDVVARLPWTNKQLLRMKVIRHKEEDSVFKRIRAAIEELGPIFVKFAQTLSTRDGLFPVELIIEFKKLEDQVQGVQTLDIIQFLTDELMIDVSDHFMEIDTQPIAAASISEVFYAVLKSEKKVILKVRRPEIIDKVKVDLSLLRDVAHILHTYQPKLQNLNLPMIVRSFELTLLDELSFSKEKSNIERFARNFRLDPLIHVPKIYADFCTDSILCMEYIDGVKITDLVYNNQSFDLETLVQNGLKNYLDQIIKYGFFHGDPHPGNLMILKDGRFVFLDFGNMGRLLDTEKKQLEFFVLAVVLKDVDWIVDLITEVAIVKNIKDYSALRRSVSEILDLIENASLGEINLNIVIDHLWKIVYENSLYFPEYIYQLIRGLSLMEGIGRILYPELNLYESISPYANDILRRKLNPRNIWKENKGLLISLLRFGIGLPKELNQLITMLKAGSIKHNHEISGLLGMSKNVRIGINKIVLSILFLSFVILAGTIIIADNVPKFLGLPVWSLIFIGFAFLILLLIMRNSISDK